jgi:hypothetical protein
MAQKRKLSELSKRAQELLKEIRGESVSSEMDNSKTKKAIQKNIVEDEETKKPLTFDRLIQGKDFDPLLYRSLSASNKLPLWILGALILICLTFFITFHTLRTSEGKLQKHAQLEMEIPKLKQQIKVLEKQNKLSDDELKLIDSRLNAIKEKFPNLQKIQGFIDDIIRLFEVAHLTILNQEINFQNNPTVADLPAIPVIKPDEQSSIFSQNLGATNAQTQDPLKKPSNLNNVINKIANANLKPNMSNLNIPKLNNLNVRDKRPFGNPNQLLPEVSFLSMRLTIKGTYPNYLLARNTLTRILPSVSIPLEEIIVTSKSEVEIRVIFDIPFINVDDKKLINKK